MEAHEFCAFCASGEPMEHNPEPSPSPVYVLWHGGPNYADPWITDHLELFDNVEEAHQALLDRERNGHWWQQRVRRVKDGSDERVFFPNVEDSWMEVFYANPLDEDGMPHDNGPDLHLHYNVMDENEE